MALTRVETRAQGHEGQAPLLLLIFENITSFDRSTPIQPLSLLAPCANAPLFFFESDVFLNK